MSVHLYGKFNEKILQLVSELKSFLLTGDERTDEQTNGRTAILKYN